MLEQTKMQFTSHNAPNFEHYDISFSVQGSYAVHFEGSNCCTSGVAINVIDGWEEFCVVMDKY